MSANIAVENFGSLKYLFMKKAFIEAIRKMFLEVLIITSTYLGMNNLSSMGITLSPVAVNETS